MSNQDITTLIAFIVGGISGGAVVWAIMKNRILKLEMQISDLRFKRHE